MRLSAALGNRSAALCLYTALRRPVRLQTADIAVHSHTVVLLGRRVAHADAGRLAGVLVEGQGDVEVDQADVSVRLQHDVLGLDVAVDHRRLLRVQIGQRLRQLDRPLQHLLLVEGAVLLSGLLQVHPGDEIHDRVDIRLIAHKVIDPGQIGLPQILEDVHFRPVVQLPFDVILDALDRHIRLDAQMVSLIDLASAAGAENLFDPIRIVQHIACLKHSLLPSARSSCLRVCTTLFRCGSYVFYHIVK